MKGRACLVLLIAAFALEAAAATDPLVTATEFLFTTYDPLPSDAQIDERFSRDYHIISRIDSEIIEGLFRIIENPALGREHVGGRLIWNDAFWALGIAASVRSEPIDFQRLTSAIIALESSTSPPLQLVSYLGYGYDAVGRFGTPAATEFLVQRTTPVFWEGRDIKSKVSHGDEVHTPRLGAITSINILATEQSNARVRQLAHDFEKSGDRDALRHVEIAIWLIPERQHAYAIHREIYKKYVLRDSATPSTAALAQSQKLPKKDVPAVPRADPAAQPVATESRGKDSTFSKSTLYWGFGILVVTLAAVLVFRKRE